MTHKDEISSSDTPSTVESTHHIRTLPPDHNNPNDPFMHASTESSHEEVYTSTEESIHHIRTLPPDHKNPNDHFYPTVGEEENFSDHMETTEGNQVSITESFPEDSSIMNEEGILSDGHHMEDSEHADGTHKMHIFHTESPSHETSHHQTSTHVHMHSLNDNNTPNENTASENSHSEREHHELTESSQNSVEYTTESIKEDDEMNSGEGNGENISEPTSTEKPPENSNPTNFQNSSSNGNESLPQSHDTDHHELENNSAFDDNDDTEHDSKNSHRSEISSTQSHEHNWQSNASLDNENKSTKDASDTGSDPGNFITADDQSSAEFTRHHLVDDELTTNSKGNGKQTTRFMKRRKIRKSRPLTSTTEIPAVEE